jgi:deazaflavin-dependent oxidoreductase (nitroreductase family)
VIEIPPSGTRGVRLRGFPIFRAFNSLSVKIYRISRVRLGGRAGLLLTTIGARSGRTRTVALGRFAQADGSWLVVASLAGAARHPAWFINLARNPDQVWVEIGRDRYRVRPALLRGVERAEAWRRIVAQAPGYAAYERATDREIPVVRLIRT